ncbi:MAG: hypothetical protein U1C19_07195 [Methanobacteriaceae archaeon]|jgi:hypothetical protein|nr:hypothetical protein [Methanobacteriaceae archaeon]
MNFVGGIIVSYHVDVISPEKKDQLLQELNFDFTFERKANIHGACVKLLTDNEDFKEEWEDNFKFMNEDIRPHAKIISFNTGGDLKVLYEPVSRICIIQNCDYYGWIKSIALAVVSDFFEEYNSENRRYSLHASAVDFGGHALGIIGPPGTGKTTLTYGLLTDNRFNYISDDWFFTRLFDNDMVIYSSEKNSYIRDDIIEVWPEFSNNLNKVKLDNRQRGLADVKNLFQGRVRESSTLHSLVLLQRDYSETPFKRLSITEALNYMENNDFCNPHQLIRNKRKYSLRMDFLKSVFSKVDVYMLNTIETPLKSLNRIIGLLTNY